MSNNSTVEGNLTQWTHHISIVDPYKNYDIATVTVNSIVAVPGTLINIWVLAALLLSPEIRSGIRNKIICGMLVVHLTEAVILCPLSVISSTMYLLGTASSFHCSFWTIHESIYHIQDFVGNWYLLILLCVYAAQVINFEPKFTSLWIQILTIAIFVTPCVFAVLFVPLTMKSFYLDHYYDQGCFFTSRDAAKVFKSLDTAVPLTLSGLLLMATAVLKYRRYPQGRSSDTLRAQLIGAGSQIDPLHPFVAILITAVGSDFCMMLWFFRPWFFNGLGLKIRLEILIPFEALINLRIILVPFILLLFPDIRERIKTWRPWRRSALRADLVVTYQKNTS